LNFLKIPLIVLALLGLLVIAGCGDDDSEESTTAAEATETTETSEEALSVEDYAAEAEGVLVAFGMSFQSLGTEISSAASAEDFASLVDDAEGEIQTAIDEFSAIQPPEEAQEGHDQIVSALEDFSSKLTDVSDAAESGDQTALQDAAGELQTAALDFQEQLLGAAEALSEAGVDLQGSTPAPSGG